MKNVIALCLKRLFLLLVVAGALLFHRAQATPLCTDLPPSTLQVLDIKASGSNEALVSAEELGRHNEPGDLISRYTTMLSASGFVAWFDIVHRIVPRDDGSVCDAPSLVRMAFGASRRVTVLLRDAAQDPCMRQHMIDHEAAHAEAFNEVIDRFIDDNRSLFQKGMIALKQTPAISADHARARWEEGMRDILDRAKDDLLAELRAASDKIDESASAAGVDNACGGRFR